MGPPIYRVMVRFREVIPGPFVCLVFLSTGVKIWRIHDKIEDNDSVNGRDTQLIILSIKDEQI